MRDPDLVLRAERAAADLERAWDRWRTVHGFGTDPLPPVSSYVGYSLEEPWGQPRVVFGVGADEAELLAAVLNDHDCRGPDRAEVDFRASVPMQPSAADQVDTSMPLGASDEDGQLDGEAEDQAEDAYQVEALGHAEAASNADELGQDEARTPPRSRRAGTRAARSDTALPTDWRRAASSRSRAGDEQAAPRSRPASGRSRTRAQQTGSQANAVRIPSASAQPPEATDSGTALMPDYSALPVASQPESPIRVPAYSARVHVASAPVIPPAAAPLASSRPAQIGVRAAGQHAASPLGMAGGPAT